MRHQAVALAPVRERDLCAVQEAPGFRLGPHENRGLTTRWITWRAISITARPYDAGALEGLLAETETLGPMQASLIRAFARRMWQGPADISPAM